MSPDSKIWLKKLKRKKQQQLQHITSRGNCTISYTKIYNENTDANCIFPPSNNQISSLKCRRFCGGRRPIHKIFYSFSPDDISIFPFAFRGFGKAWPLYYSSGVFRLLPPFLFLSLLGFCRVRPGRFFDIGILKNGGGEWNGMSPIFFYYWRKGTGGSLHRRVGDGVCWTITCLKDSLIWYIDACMQITIYSMFLSQICNIPSIVNRYEFWTSKYFYSSKGRIELFPNFFLIWEKMYF